MADNPIRKALQPIEAGFGAMFGVRRDTNVKPEVVVGAPGFSVYGGVVTTNERDSSLTGVSRYKTFSQILADTSIVAAGVRYFLNLAAGATWSFEPAEHPDGERLAELAEKMLKEDPDTSWARIVRRAAMYRFYGFSVQEWTMGRNDEGQLTFTDIAPRAQITITGWDVATTGEVMGMEQTNPQDSKAIYLPRGKCLYMVDDSLNDSPEGLGLFRHIVKAQRRLARYEQLEGFGFEGDLRGIPIGRAPFAELNRKVASGEMTLEKAQSEIAALKSFMNKHIRNPELGVMLDSETYETQDESARPSNSLKYDVELLDGSQSSIEEVGKAIERVNHEIARVLGIESLLLGGGDGGSWALAKEKTSQFSLTVDATLDELAEGVKKDLLSVLWDANGWDRAAMPKITVEAVQHKDIGQITQALRDLAQAGAVLAPDDPVIQEVRGILGLESEAVIAGDINSDLDAGLGGSTGDDPIDDDATIDDMGDDE